MICYTDSKNISKYTYFIEVLYYYIKGNIERILTKNMFRYRDYIQG